MRPQHSDSIDKAQLRQPLVSAPVPKPVSRHLVRDRVTRSPDAAGGHPAAIELALHIAEASLGPAALQTGSAQVRAFVWSAHARFTVGAWDEAADDADRAVSLLEEAGHESLRPLARCVAVLVPAARGEWTTADEHARAAASKPGGDELMVVAAALAQAHLAAARSDHHAVLRALEPVLPITLGDGTDETELWPWQGLYGDALVHAGRLTDADEFLRPHEDLAATGHRGSTIARLARVRGKLEAAQDNLAAAETAFQRGLAEIEGLAVPFQRALLELAYGQMLRRAGQRRAAAQQLRAARDRLAGLRARPYLERCERELAACGLTPAKRNDFDPNKLTAQESAVARLVALGMGNRQVAAELFISIKTVQFHLTHIYAKLAINSRAELAAQFRDTDSADRTTLGHGLGHDGESNQPHPVRGELHPAGSKSPIARGAGVDSPPLTPQESAVARLVALGMGNRQVAAELFVSIKTVQFHLTHIYAKLAISTRAELAAQLLDTDTTDRTTPRRRSGQNSFEGKAIVERCNDSSASSGSLSATPDNGSAHRLTKQESAIARLVTLGKDDRQIAADLFIGITAVHRHLDHIYTKLGVSSRTELIEGDRGKTHNRWVSPGTDITQARPCSGGQGTRG